MVGDRGIHFLTFGSQWVLKFKRDQEQMDGVRW